MSGMRNLGTKYGAFTAMGSITVLLLAAAPALASTQQATSSVTGPEIVYGAVHGAAANADNPHIPLTFSGVVSTTAPGFVLGGGADQHGLKTKAGTLFVQTGKPTDIQSGNSRTCRETFTQYQTFNVLGSKSTGAFAGASGPGAVQVYSAAFAPRYTSGSKKGQCNFNGNPLNKGAVTTFIASIVLTVK